MRHPSAGGAFGRTLRQHERDGARDRECPHPGGCKLCVCRNLTHVVVLFNDLVGQCPHWVERGSGLRVRDGRRSGVNTCEQETHRRPARSGRTRGHHRDRRRSRSGRSRTSADAHVRTARAACLREGDDRPRGLLRQGPGEQEGRRPDGDLPAGVGAVAGPAARGLQPERHQRRAAARSPSSTPTATRTSSATSASTVSSTASRPAPGERLPEDHRPERRHQPAAHQRRAGHRSRRSTSTPCPPPAPTARS